MRFFGDIAVPDSESIKYEIGSEKLDAQVGVANMEGLIAENPNTLENCLYNGVEIIEFLNKFNIKAVSLANNHINDCSLKFEKTINMLKKAGIKYFGAGRSAYEARKPAILWENGHKYLIFGFGWNVIGCRKNRDFDLFINQLTYDNVMLSINKAKSKYQVARIICFFHWDYELEIYPQPLHRLIAHDAISNGAFAVVGCHPHCVQPVEIYKERIIAYSLGNYAIPNGVFLKGKLRYPDIAKDEMILEIQDNEIRYLHLRYDGEKTVSILCDYDFCEVKAEFTGIGQKDYIKYFKKNRRKKFLLPVFVASDDKSNERIYSWIKIREKVIKCLYAINLKSGPK